VLTVNYFGNNAAELGMNYQFALERISQHVVKFGMNIQPAFALKDDRPELQDYGNWLIEQYPQAFETLLSGPNQFLLQKRFPLANGKRADMPTFALTPRGLLFTFPQRLFIDTIQNLHVPEKDEAFRRALEQFQAGFPDRQIRRLDVVHEFIFDTDQTDSLQIIASNLKSDSWRQQARNLHIHIEVPIEGKNVAVDIKPTHLMKSGPPNSNVPGHIVRYGIIVNTLIHHLPIKGPLGDDEIDDLLTFADQYVPEELIGFLNNEY